MNQITPQTALQDQLLRDFKRFENALNGSAKAETQVIREQALEVFKTLGFPTQRHEEWKYTSVQPLFKYDWKTCLPDDASELTREDIAPLLFKKLQATVLVVVNGVFKKELSMLLKQADGIITTGFKNAESENSELFKKHFAQHAAFKNEAFTALSTAFAHDGAFVFVPNGKVAEHPIHIVNIIDSRAENMIAQPRNLIILGKNSQATIIETTHTLGENESFKNAVSEIFLDENAVLKMHIVQNDSDNSFAVNTTQVHQERTSNFTATTVSLGGGVIRNNMNALLNGEHCESNFNGLYVLKSREHVDNHTLADHAVPNCQSNELYKGILDDESTGVFNGKIMVRADAQKTNAFQSNRNILLSKNATINTKPQLEIYADDVKCSHGATTGQLDEEAMFYLRARGLGEEKARALLLHAFAADVLQKIDVAELCEELLRLIDERLHIEDEVADVVDEAV